MMTLLKRMIMMCAVMIMAAPVAGHAAPVIGEPAPEFTLTDTDGQTHSLSDFAGKTVVLEWTNHECPYVIKHYDTGNMQALQKEATANDTVWLTIISSAPGKQGYVSAEEAAMIMTEAGSAETARLFDEDGTVGQLYAAKTTPHMFVINPDGVLAYKGAIDDNSSPRLSSVEGATNYVQLALNAIAAGKMPETTETQPYGCSVKY